MTGSNGQVVQQTDTKNVLSHTKFYAACECLKKNKQTFLDERPRQDQAAVMLTKLTGFEVSKHSLVNICEATGITWESRRERELMPVLVQLLVTVIEHLPPLYIGFIRSLVRKYRNHLKLFIVS